jgi:uncharacterized protein YkwD
VRLRALASALLITGCGTFSGSGQADWPLPSDTGDVITSLGPVTLDALPADLPAVFETLAPLSRTPCLQNAALTAVAEALALRSKNGESLPHAHEVTALIRLAGSPLPAPTAILLRGSGDLLAKVQMSPSSQCGIGLQKGLAVVIAAEGLATMSALKTQVQIGKYLPFRAALSPGVQAPELLALDPDGAVRSVPLREVETNVFVAYIHARIPGRTEIQLMGTLADGPRPLLEAAFRTGAPATTASAAAPSSEDTEASLDQSINDLRKKPLARSASLDALAHEHCEAMMRSRRLAHDAGDGLPTKRAARLHVLDVGENVAHADSVALANRGLTRSPSHRRNRMRADWTHLGVGVARDSDGSFWVSELFASFSAP